MELICTHCGTEVVSDEAAPRCPQCLRKSTLVSPAAATELEARHRLGNLWPAGDLCPLCGEREVGEEVFYLRLSKAALQLNATEKRWLAARSRCCAPCRRRVERVEIWRLVAGLSLLAGLLAPFALVLLLGAWDMRLTGETLAAAMLWLAAAILVPLVLFRRFHNRVRGLLEASWVVETLRGEVTMPSGIPIYDLVNIYAKHHGEEPPLDLATQTDPQA